MGDKTKGTQKFSRHKEIYEYTAENDIKYRGPLSYRMHPADSEEE